MEETNKNTPLTENTDIMSLPESKSPSAKIPGQSVQFPDISQKADGGSKEDKETEKIPEEENACALPQPNRNVDIEIRIENPIEKLKSQFSELCALGQSLCRRNKLNPEERRSFESSPENIIKTMRIKLDNLQSDMRTYRTRNVSKMAEKVATTNKQILTGECSSGAQHRPTAVKEALLNSAFEGIRSSESSKKIATCGCSTGAHPRTISREEAPGLRSKSSKRIATGKCSSKSRDNPMVGSYPLPFRISDDIPEILENISHQSTTYEESLDYELAEVGTYREFETYLRQPRTKIRKQLVGNVDEVDSYENFVENFKQKNRAMLLLGSDLTFFISANIVW